MSVGPSVRCWFRIAFRFQRLAWCSSASRFLLERNEQQIQHRGLQTAHSKGHNCGVEPFRAPRPFCGILVILRKHVKSPAPLGDCSGARMHPRNVARLCGLGWCAKVSKCMPSLSIIRQSFPAVYINPDAVGSCAFLSAPFVDVEPHLSSATPRQVLMQRLQLHKRAWHACFLSLVLFFSCSVNQFLAGLASPALHGSNHVGLEQAFLRRYYGCPLRQQ